MGGENILNQIQKFYLSMSEVERRIADYILKHPQKTVNMTMRNLAQETGVSQGSIANFSLRLGFSGYSQLKIQIAQSLSTHNDLIFNNVGEEDSVKDTMKKVMDNAVSAFQATYAVNSREDFERAADLLMGAKRKIDLYGLASSSVLALDAYYRMMRLGLPAVAVTDSMICQISASMLDKECLAMAFSYTGRTDDLLKAMQAAKKRGAKTICITSYADSPLARLCDITLIAASKEREIQNISMTSRMVQLLLLDSLCAYIDFQKKEFTIRKRLEINEMLDDQYRLD